MALAAELDVVVVGGFCEDGDGGRAYNAAAVIDGDGVRALYRKAHLWDREQLIFAPGNMPTSVVETRHGRLAVMICYDLEFPEWVRRVADERADLLCVPTNWPQFPRPTGERPMEVVRAQAQAAMNQIFIAVCDQTGLERNVDWVGASTIIDPDRWPLAGPLRHGETASIMARCDLRRVRDKRLNTRNDVLADRRSELYATSVIQASRTQ